MSILLAVHASVEIAMRYWRRAVRRSFECGCRPFGTLGSFAGLTQHSCAGLERHSAPSGLVRKILSADVDHGARGWDEAGFTDVVPRFLLLDSAFDEVGQVGIGGSVAHGSIEVMLANRE